MKGYNGNREVLEKQLRAAYSEFLHAYENGLNPETELSKEDVQKIKDIEDMMNELLKKLRNSNENK